MAKKFDALYADMFCIQGRKVVVQLFLSDALHNSDSCIMMARKPMKVKVFTFIYL